MTGFYIMTGFILVVLSYLIFRPTKETLVTIKSKQGKSTGKTYLAKKTIGTTGNSPTDWVYYLESGDTIEDPSLIKLIYDSFVNEDWYGDYEFYVDDVLYYSNTTFSEEVQNEETVMNSVEEMEEAIGVIH